MRLSFFFFSKDLSVIRLKKWLISVFFSQFQVPLTNLLTAHHRPISRSASTCSFSGVTVLWKIAGLGNHPSSYLLHAVYSCATGRHDSGKYSLMGFWHGRHTWEGFLLWESVGWQIWPLGSCQIWLGASWGWAACLVLVTLRLVLPDRWITLKSSQSLPLALFRVKSKRFYESICVLRHLCTENSVCNVG